jgi:hypothetical protein
VSLSESVASADVTAASAKNVARTSQSFITREKRMRTVKISFFCSVLFRRYFNGDNLSERLMRIAMPAVDFRTLSKCYRSMCLISTKSFGAMCQKSSSPLFYQIVNDNN